MFLTKIDIIFSSSKFVGFLWIWLILFQANELLDRHLSVSYWNLLKQLCLCWNEWQLWYAGGILENHSRCISSWDFKILEMPSCCHSKSDNYARHSWLALHCIYGDFGVQLTYICHFTHVFKDLSFSAAVKGCYIICIFFERRIRFTYCCHTNTSKG